MCEAANRSPPCGGDARQIISSMTFVCMAPPFPSPLWGGWLRSSREGRACDETNSFVVARTPPRTFGPTPPHKGEGKAPTRKGQRFVRVANVRNRQSVSPLVGEMPGRAEGGEWIISSILSNALPPFPPPCGRVAAQQPGGALLVTPQNASGCIARAILPMASILAGPGVISA